MKELKDRKSSDHIRVSEILIPTLNTILHILQWVSLSISPPFRREGSHLPISSFYPLMIKWDFSDIRLSNSPAILITKSIDWKQVPFLTPLKSESNVKSNWQRARAFIWFLEDKVLLLELAGLWGWKKNSFLLDLPISNLSVISVSEQHRR